MKTIFKTKISANFTTLPNAMLRDKRLSFRARGLLAMVLTNRNDWEVNRTWLESQATEGREAVKAALDELKALGYVTYTRVREADSRRFSHNVWCFHDCEGNHEKPYDGKPSDGKPSDGKPSTSEELWEEGSSNRKNNRPGKVAGTDGDASHNGESSHRTNGKSSHPSKNGRKYARIKLPPTNGKSSHHPKQNGQLFTDSNLPPTFLQDACDRLENFVRKNYRVDRRHNPKAWINFMRLLLQDLNGDQKRLLSVLDRFINSRHDRFTPIVRSADSFRDKFVSIERWLQNHNGGDSYVAPAPVGKVVRRVVDPKWKPETFEG